MAPTRNFTSSGRGQNGDEPNEGIAYFGHLLSLLMRSIER